MNTLMVDSGLKKGNPPGPKGSPGAGRGMDKAGPRACHRGSAPQKAEGKMAIEDRFMMELSVSVFLYFPKNPSSATFKRIFKKLVLTDPLL